MATTIFQCEAYGLFHLRGAGGKGIHLERGFPVGATRWHRVMVGLERHLALGIQADHIGVPALLVVNRQRPQRRLFLPPGFADGCRLSGHPVLIVGRAAGRQARIELVKRVRLRHENRKVAAVKAGAGLDAALAADAHSRVT